MIGFTLRETAIAVMSFILLGGLFGILYKAFLLLFVFAAYTANVAKQLMQPTRRLVPILRADFRHSDAPLNGIKKELFDFLFYAVFGLSYIIAVYATQDGCFRLYGILFTVLAFLLSSYAAAGLENALSKLILTVIRLFLLVLNLLLSPVRWLKELSVGISKALTHKKNGCLKRRKSKKNEKVRK